MKKQDFALFYSLPLDGLDWQNLAASHVKRVMLLLPFCDTTTLDRLNSMGVRLIIRVPEDAYYDIGAPVSIREQVRAISRHIGIAGVVVGNEPDNAFSFEDGAPTWGADYAYAHRDAFDRVRDLLQREGFPVVSPGLTMRSISEDEPPQPGQYTWAEILRLSYDKAHGNAVHLYTYNWLSIIDQSRVKFALKHYEGMHHMPIWIDEININSGTPLARMTACIAIANLLLTHELGKRVVSFCPFVSNGDGNGWPIGYLLRDPACYQLLGQWMSQ